MTINTEFKFCSGKHKCEICFRIYSCDGIDYGHDKKQKGFRCHGEYLQFCNRHSINTYIKKHREQGDII